MPHRRFLEKALAGDRSGARAYARELLASGWELERVYLDCFQPALVEVSERWLRNELSVADEHLVSAIVEGLLAEFDAQVPPVSPEAPVALLASVPGEDHRLGQLIVAGLWSLAGWRVLALGSNVPGDALALSAQRFRPRLVGLSVTMRHHLPSAELAIRALKELPGHADVTVLAGGAAFQGQEALALSIGADGLARDGWEALAFVRGLKACPEGALRGT